MAATWTRLQSDERPYCASANHGEERAVATWRMESEGKVGSYYCETCRYLITRGPRYFGDTVPITTTPTKR